MHEAMTDFSGMNIQLFREAAVSTIGEGLHDSSFLPFLLKLLFEAYITKVPNLSYVEAVEVRDSMYVLRDGSVVDASKILHIEKAHILLLQLLIGK